MSRAIIGAPRSEGDFQQIVRRAYGDASWLTRHKQSLRLEICPFHLLVDAIPNQSSILDVGCGGGLFLVLLACFGKVQFGLGFDANAQAIQIAQQAADRLPQRANLYFEHRDLRDGWPEGRFDVVSVIDVVHHLPRVSQAALITEAAEHVAPGGILLYKDMSQRSLWCAWGNRLHDLLFAGQWINYAGISDVIAWARQNRLVHEAEGRCNILWYAHEWCVFRRPVQGAA